MVPKVASNTVLHNSLHETGMDDGFLQGEQG